MKESAREYRRAIKSVPRRHYVITSYWSNTSNLVALDISRSIYAYTRMRAYEKAHNNVV